MISKRELMFWRIITPAFSVACALIARIAPPFLQLDAVGVSILVLILAGFWFFGVPKENVKQ